MYLALISDIPVLSIKYQKDTGPYLFGYTPVSKLKNQVLCLCVTQSTPTLADTLPRSQAWVPPSGRPRAAGWAESIFARLHSLCPSVEAFPLFSVESTTAPIELLEVWGPVFDPGEYD